MQRDTQPSFRKQAAARAPQAAGALLKYFATCQPR